MSIAIQSIGRPVRGRDQRHRPERPVGRRRHRRDLARDRCIFRAGVPRSIADRRAACAISPPASVRWRSAAPPRRPGRRRLAIPQIGDISNLDEDHKVRDLFDRRRLDLLGNRLWHTDASYMPVPVVLGMLHAVALPPPSPFGNGETEFADMRAAYDELSGATQGRDRRPDRGTRCVLVARAGRLHRFSPNRAGHNIRHRRNVWCARIRDRNGRRCTCRRTPRTSSAGRWRMGGCCCSISTRTRRGERFVYRHEWRIGDLVIWDNRCTMHRGRPHDETKAARSAPRHDVGQGFDAQRGGVRSSRLAAFRLITASHLAEEVHLAHRARRDGAECCRRS